MMFSLLILFGSLGSSSANVLNECFHYSRLSPRIIFTQLF